MILLPARNRRRQLSIPSAIKEIAPGVYVIGDRRVPLVPNIGIILGRDAALVVDTGMGPANGEKVLAAAKRVAGRRPLILTLTHFHPEHGFGAQAFKGVAKIHYNRAQRDELRAKGEGYLGMFKTFGPRRCRGSRRHASCRAG